MAEDPVVSVDWLLAALGGSTPPRVIDVRWRLGGGDGSVEFAAGHVPGAVNVDLETELAGPVAAGVVGGRHPLPTESAVSALVRRAGIDAARSVVVMDGSDGTPAARAWWILRHAGHPDVHVLDGGWPAWVAAGGPVETGPGVAAPPGEFVVRWGAMPTIDADTVRDVAVLIDARAGVRYRGEVEPVDPVAGHIPGAVNVPYVDDLDAEGRWLPLSTVREAYAALGLDDGARVAAYCGSGVTATHTVLALERLGITAALYPGSWSDWVSDATRPVATGG